MFTERGCRLRRACGRGDIGRASLAFGAFVVGLALAGPRAEGCAID